MIGRPNHIKDIKPNLKMQDVGKTRSDVVAFTAQLFNATTVLENSTIIFDDEIHNIGGHYSPHSGQFICPDNNLYVFMWSLQKDRNSLEGMRCISTLQKGTTKLKYGPKTSYHSTSYSGTTEIVAVLQCNYYEDSTDPPTAISVMMESWSEIWQTADFDHRRTIFSGLRLLQSVGFTVELYSEVYLADGRRIMFDKVVSNFGGYYDVINGRFRCPDNGIYVFSVSAQTTDPAFPWSVSRLMQEGIVVVQGPITYQATEAYDSGSSSITVVLQCTTDDSIYVEAQATHDFPINSYGPTLTSFTGFKLYDVTPDAVAFTAVMTNNQTANLSEPLQLDNVVTNIGECP